MRASVKYPEGGMLVKRRTMLPLSPVVSQSFSKSETDNARFLETLLIYKYKYFQCFFFFTKKDAFELNPVV
jgi:hypothetical protein